MHPFRQTHNHLPSTPAPPPQVFIPRFDAVEALQLIERHNVSSFIAVPTMLQDLVTAARAAGSRGSQVQPGAARSRAAVAPLSLPSVRRLLVGAGGTPPVLQVRLRARVCFAARAQL